MKDCTAPLTGWLDLAEAWGPEIGPYRYATVYHVYQWSESRDSGQIIGTYWKRSEAITSAHQGAEGNQHKVASADVIPLRREAAHA